MIFDGEQNALFFLSAVLIAGMLGGWLARLARLPQELGYTAAGLLIGPAALNLFGEVNIAASLKPVTEVALGVLAVSAGSHLCYRRLHNALGRVGAVALGESAASMALVTLAARWVGVDWPTALVLGAISVATSPATTITLVREMRAKGIFVKTLLSVVAVDILLCMLVFALAYRIMDYAYSGEGQRLGPLWIVLRAGSQVLLSLALGLVMGRATGYLIHRARFHRFSLVLVMVLFTVGISDFLGVNFLLSCMFYGVFLTNASESGTRHAEALEPLEPLLYVGFFTAAGASLHLDAVAEAGILCAVFLVARFAGKYLGALAGGWVARMPARMNHHVGLALAPQTGIAIGLVVLLEANPNIPEHTISVIGTMLLGAITVNEILGPLFTWHALRRSGEAGRDRRRIMDFLQEEHIAVPFEAETRDEALRNLVERYAFTHHLSDADRAALEESVLRREAESSTNIGRGVAVPHGTLKRGRRISGVLAVSRNGVPFDDGGEPVRVLVLLVTPPGMANRHLEVMSSLARMVSDNTMHDRLLSALSPYDVAEALQSQEARPYNYFLDDRDEEPAFP
ncbi:MAG TPA: cation:proton antiporter [Candidatus Hydrogenedentes bacterium]|nr:cation:proton antiporter [Candidatus Hydrogenedentota bacterium]